MIHQNLNAILEFIWFGLKDDAKRWMYGIKVGSIESWDPFIDIFLMRYFPLARPLDSGMKSSFFVQLEHETFWKCMNRFKALLTQCPHHGLERWNLCPIAYEGLDVGTTTLVESISGREFLYKNVNEARDFLEDLSDQTYE